MRQRYLISTLLAAVGALLFAIISLGQGAHDGDWHTVDGGGGVSTGSTFTVRGTAGQPDAGVSSGVTYTVRGAFWGGAVYRASAASDLALRKTVTTGASGQAAVAVPGDTITYTLVFSNAGPGTAVGVVITDTIPISVATTAVVSGGVVITPRVGTRYVWDVQDLSAGQRGIITITGVLSDPLPAATFTNTAVITSTALEGDTANNTGAATISINNPPSADAGPDRTVVISATVTLDGSGSYDPDGHTPLTYGWAVSEATTGGPGVTLDDSTAVSPTFTAPGTSTVLTFTLIVTDALGLGSAPDAVVITVTNTPPTISNILDQSTGVGIPVGPIGFTIGDAETDAAALALDGASSNTTLVPLANILFGGSGANRTVTLTPAAGLTGTTVITVTVSDGELDASDSFVLTVGVNAPPEFTSTPAETATVGVTYVYTATATDPDADDTLTITASTLPGWLILTDHGGGTATLAGVPDTANDYAVVLRASDGQAQATQAFTITVEAAPPVNTPPTISNIYNQSTEVGKPLTVTFIIGDAETGLADLTLSCASSNLALVPVDNVTFEGSGADRTATITPTDGLTGTARITITVSDGELDASDSFILAVGVNAPPEFTSSPDLAATVGVTYTYDVTAADPDTGDVLTIAAPVSPVWLTLVDHGDRTATLSGTPDTEGDYPVVLQVGDGQVSVTQAFSIAVGSPIPALHIVKSVEGRGEGVGGTLNLPSSGVVTYTIVLDNNGNGAATGVVMTDGLPPGVSFGYQLQGSALLPLPPDDVTLQWGPYDILAGESRVIRFTANITTNRAFAGATITNTACFTSTNAGSGSDDAVFTIRSLSTIYLPLLFRGFPPPFTDLVVESLTATRDTVTVVIGNAGNTPVSEAFWVDVYFNPTITPTVNLPWPSIADHGVVWYVNVNVPAGDSLVLVTGGPYYDPGNSSEPPLPTRAAVYALVDSFKVGSSYGAVHEGDESNNLFGPVAPIP
jgi:uncharacterized repeat protein (TIGR01451 family)